MSLVNTATRYGVVSQSLHWLTVLLVIVLLISGKVGEIEVEGGGNALYYWHSSLGVLVLAVVVARIVWRFVTPPPKLPKTTSTFARSFAQSLHIAFYALLVALPLSGWLVASAEGAPVRFFGVMTLPRWEVSSFSSTPRETPRSELDRVTGQQEEGEGAGEELFEEVHEVLGNLLLVFAILHAMAALKHHFVDKDDILARMLPTRSRSAPRERA